MNTIKLSSRISYQDSISCDNCGEKFECASSRQIEMFICPNCKNIQSKINSEAYKKIKIPDPKKKPRVVIGERGIYKEKPFQIIGIVQKFEDSFYQAEWWELTAQRDGDGSLFFISFWNGHYTFLEQTDIKKIAFDKTDFRKNLDVEGTSFVYHSRYGYKTNYAVGAFPYDVIDVSKNVCYDFVSPPFQLSIEQDKTGELTAFLGEYLTPKETSKVFNKAELAIYDREGVAPAQPFYGGIKMKVFNRISLIFLLVFTGVLIFMDATSVNHVIYKKTITVNDSLPSSDLISNSFNLDEQLTPYFLAIEGYMNVSNNWTEIQTSLVNEKTGTEKEVALGIEYYSGVDNGYSWSEGSNSSTVYLSGIEPGRYHLKSRIIKPSGIGENTLTLTVRTDSPWAWNYRILVIPFGIFLIIMNLLSRQFERMRSGEIDSLFESSQ